MKKYKSLAKRQRVVAGITCDWCKKGSMKDGFFAGGSGTISFGYGSKMDGRAYSFDICDGCFGRLIKPHVKLEKRKP